MAEWHLAPDYILDNWTDEQLELYVGKLVERKQRESDAIAGKPKVVSEKEILAKMGIKVVEK